MARQQKNSGKSTEPGVRAADGPRMARLRRLRPNRRLCLIVSGYALTIVLCVLASYLRWAPLPALAVPPVAEAASTSSLIAGRTGSKASLDACLRQVKMRDLFKPSVPVPVDGGLGKTTAQELADRMQFLGVMEDAGGLAALVFIPNRGPGTFHVGDRVAEFVLKDVRPDRLTLEMGEEQAILKR